MKSSGQLKFFFYEGLKNSEYAKIKQAERSRLHEAVKAAQEQRRMEGLLTSVQLLLTFPEPKRTGIAPDQLVTMAYHYRTELFQMSLSLTRNHSDAQDLLQETWIRVHAKAHLYNDLGGNLKGWVKVIMKNLFIAEYRAGQKMPTDFQEENDFVTTVAYNRAEEEIKKGDVLKALNKLPLNQRTICTLYWIERYKYSEIAEELNLPLGTVKNQIHLARKELKQLLGDYAI